MYNITNTLALLTLRSERCWHIMALPENMTLSKTGMMVTVLVIWRFTVPGMS